MSGSVQNPHLFLTDDVCTEFSDICETEIKELYKSREFYLNVYSV